MKYLGIVKQQDGSLLMPDSFRAIARGHLYEAIQVGSEILLIAAPLDRERLGQIQELADLSIEEHRRTLEGLAR